MFLVGGAMTKDVVLSMIKDIPEVVLVLVLAVKILKIVRIV
jgi:hypothetical protein